MWLDELDSAATHFWVHRDDDGLVAAARLTFHPLGTQLPDQRSWSHLWEPSGDMAWLGRLRSRGKARAVPIATRICWTRSGWTGPTVCRGGGPVRMGDCAFPHRVTSLVCCGFRVVGPFLQLDGPLRSLPQLHNLLLDGV